ncbi:MULTISPECIES: EamA family transporter [unclassified Haladaptatus]|uniref:EamA family transporter n=1 Tax=unclassified Haladaptatus TaxID=2622732 RepID=UPI00209C2D38|nr:MULTISPECIES: EamA family transporter [unclassified Haladaptatus]MCO8246315.1 EamA family transporter [Haladaptatus sp. AB643]MCO8255218.1 EamA family transporter [Haladaptatus sp. AB618]
MVRTAIYFALVGMLTWGVWAVFADLATRTLAPEVAMAISYVVGVGVAIAYIAVQSDPVSLSGSGVAFAVAGGVFSGIGSISYYAALQRGNTAIATTVTALYFVVAAVLGVLFLGDSVDLRDLAGIGLAIGAVALLAT